MFYFYIFSIFLTDYNWSFRFVIYCWRSYFYSWIDFIFEWLRLESCCWGCCYVGVIVDCLSTRIFALLTLTLFTLNISLTTSSFKLTQNNYLLSLLRADNISFTSSTFLSPYLHFVNIISNFLYLLKSYYNLLKFFYSMTCLNRR